MYYLCVETKTTKIMRNIIILLLSFCIAANVNAKSLSTSEKKVLNVILREVTPKRPRTGDFSLMINCYYYDGRIHVEFYEPVEDVNVSVTNVNTGEQYDTFAFGANQSVYVDVPTTSGQYYVEIECDSATWCGEYYL